ncbi:MAG: PEPxxWA-CTERM sorting domain-containing protein [Proteobacteria bacterium]|nr:PEPxxWA-CTERM sorting domain-containing protein [Pseudomonadota bacterium]
MKRAALLAATLFGITANQADAAIVTRHFLISANGFAADAPVQTASGIFSFTYDEAAFLTPVAPVTKVTSFNVPFNGPALFTYNKGNNFLMVSNNITGLTAFTITPNAPTFGFFIKNPGGAPQVTNLSYSANGKIFSSSQVAVQALAAVPEPASWALMIGGFGLAGAALRTRPRVAFA